jgi:hypothetical protein
MIKPINGQFTFQSHNIIKLINLYYSILNFTSQISNTVYSYANMYDYIEGFLYNIPNQFHWSEDIFAILKEA